MIDNYRLKTKINIKQRYSSKFGFVLPYTDLISDIKIIKFYNRFIDYLNKKGDYKDFNYVIIRVNEKNQLVAKFMMFSNIEINKDLIEYLKCSKSSEVVGIVSNYNKRDSIHYGLDYVWSYISDTIVRSNISSFCQVNPHTRNLIYDSVIEYVQWTECKNLYCIGGEMMYYMLNLEMDSYYGCTNCNYIFEDAKATDPKGKEIVVEYNNYTKFWEAKEDTIIILNVFKIYKSIIEFIKANKTRIKYIVVISCQEKQVDRLKEFNIIKSKDLSLMPHTKAKEFVQLRET